MRQTRLGAIKVTIPTEDFQLWSNYPFECSLWGLCSGSLILYTESCKNIFSI